MAKTARPEPFFIAGHNALDLLNSVCAPWGNNIEWIENCDDLLAWMEQSCLISIDDSYWFRSKFSSVELNQVSAMARDLRERFRTFIKENHDQSADTNQSELLTLLNSILNKGNQYHKIEIDKTTHVPEMHLKYRWQTSEDILVPLAKTMSDYICNTDFSQTKNCEGENCTLWFIDTSKSRKRRWCSMAVCGNRAKVTAHRARMKKL